MVNAFLESLRMVNTEARLRLPEANIVAAGRRVGGDGTTGERLGLGTREERSTIRKKFIEKARPLDSLTSTGRMFSDSLGLNR